MITVAPIPEDIPDYDRDDWKHWVDEDGDCQDARQEVLITESLVSVSFNTDRECKVETGRWYGAFTGVYTDDPRGLDIDHLVPLKNAHLSGGWRWDADMRGGVRQLPSGGKPPDRSDQGRQPVEGSKGAGGVGTAGPGLLVPVRHGLDGSEGPVGTDDDHA